MIKVLSFPSRHPYTSKFHQAGEIFFINPDTDYFNHIGGKPFPEFLENTHPKDSYDLVHIHFSFDKLTILELKELLQYFKRINKPIVWTCHSRESLRDKDIGNGELQKMLYLYASAIITPTSGCRDWIISKYGNNKEVSVIPLGYMINPATILANQQSLDKKLKTNFVYLVGDLRKNKEINYSIKTFLESKELSDCTLTVITKLFSSDLDERGQKFLKIIHSSPRIRVIAQPEVSNDLLAEIFCKQHACFHPYLWGTHSGQVELARDCGCYSIISNVGFYKEQFNGILDFEYNDDLSVFMQNFLQALIMAKNLPLLSPQPQLRKKEAEVIIKKHVELYKKLLISKQY